MARFDNPLICFFAIVCGLQAILLIAIPTLMNDMVETQGGYNLTIVNSGRDSPVSLIRDWETIPFVSLTVVDGDVSCRSLNENFEAVIYQDFLGIKQICRCRDVKANAVNEGSCEDLGLPLSQCDTIEGFDSWEQESIKGKKLCGKRGGKSFKNVIRPDYVTGKCKPGYEPCYPMEWVKSIE